jgi:hypothetical protein
MQFVYSYESYIGEGGRPSVHGRLELPNWSRRLSRPLNEGEYDVFQYTQTPGFEDDRILICRIKIGSSYLYLYIREPTLT